MSAILPKNELENVKFYPSLLGKKFFVPFLGELKKKQKALSKLTDLYHLRDQLHDIERHGEAIHEGKLPFKC